MAEMEAGIMARCMRVRGKQGSVLILFALIIDLLLGVAALALDLGLIYIAKQRVQGVCDAAALAGARRMSSYGSIEATLASATQAANNCTKANNGVSEKWDVLSPETNQPGIKVSFPTQITTADGQTIQVAYGQALRVDGYMDVNLIFPSFIGRSLSKVPASSTVLREKAKTLATDLFVPLAASETTIFGNETYPPAAFGQRIAMKVGKWQDCWIGPGNFGTVVLPGCERGAAAIYIGLTGQQAPITIQLDQQLTIETEPGNMSGPVAQGLTDRLNKETDPRFAPTLENEVAWHNWFDSYDPRTGLYASTWRLAIVPIIEDVPGKTGRTDVTVVGFAGFFLESLSEDSTSTTVYGRFIQGMKCGERITWVFPNGSPASDLDIMTAVRLVN